MAVEGERLLKNNDAYSNLLGVSEDVAKIESLATIATPIIIYLTLV